MEYYSAIKRNKVLIHATTWIILENIMLSKKKKKKKKQSHTQKVMLYNSINSSPPLPVGCMFSEPQVNA